MTHFSDERNLENASKFIQEKQNQLSELQPKLLSAKKSKNSELVEKYPLEIDEMVAFLQEIQKIPTGMAALELAEKEAEKFLMADEKRLYRGEVLLKIGLARLHVFLEPEKAENWLGPAENWLTQTRRAHAYLSDFQIPEKSMKISQPPEKTFYHDEWGNIKDSSPKPGDLVNRLSCDWYLDDLLARTYRFLGFLAFYKENIPEAKRHFLIMKMLDERVSFPWQRMMPICSTDLWLIAIKDCFGRLRKRIFALF